jgi:hypothetical protein
MKKSPETIIAEMLARAEKAEGQGLDKKIDALHDSLISLAEILADISQDLKIIKAKPGSR